MKKTETIVSNLNADQRDFDTTSVNSDPSTPKVESVADLSMSNEENEVFVFSKPYFQIFIDTSSGTPKAESKEYIPQISLDDVWTAKDYGTHILYLIKEIDEKFYSLDKEVFDDSTTATIESNKNCVYRIGMVSIRILSNIDELFRWLTSIIENFDQESESEILELIIQIENGVEEILDLYNQFIDTYERIKDDDNDDLLQQTFLMNELLECFIVIFDLNLSGGPRVSMREYVEYEKY